jgi:death on curing protein
MTAWQWLDHAVIRAVHDAQLAEHGGAAGLRDATLLESALAKPINLANYESPDAAALAASYGYGISRNHPFLDGNKRTAFVAMELFLYLNGYELTADDVECVTVMLGVAAGDIKEPDFAQWLRDNMAPMAAS